MSRKSSAPILPIPIDPSVRPDKAHAHVLAPFGETGRGFARQPVLDHQLAASARMNVMIETATGLRTPSGVMASAIPARVQASTSTVS